jgi:hypothetical protein
MLIRQIEAYACFIRGLSLSVKLKPMLLIFEAYASFIQSLCSFHPEPMLKAYYINIGSLCIPVLLFIRSFTGPMPY